MTQDGAGHAGQQLRQARPFLPGQARRGQCLAHVGQAAQEGGPQALQVVAQALPGHSLDDLSGRLGEPSGGQQGPRRPQAPVEAIQRPHQQRVVTATLLLRQAPLHQREVAAAQLPGEGGQPLGARRALRCEQLLVGRRHLAEAAHEAAAAAVGELQHVGGGRGGPQLRLQAAQLRLQPPPRVLQELLAQLLRRLAQGQQQLHALGLLRGARAALPARRERAASSEGSPGAWCERRSGPWGEPGAAPEALAQLLGQPGRDDLAVVLDGAEGGQVLVLPQHGACAALVAHRLPVGAQLHALGEARRQLEEELQLPQQRVDPWGVRGGVRPEP